MEIEESTLYAIGTLLLFLSLALLGIFIFLLRSMRSDTIEACFAMKAMSARLLVLQNGNERTFKEMEVMLDRKVKFIFSGKPLTLVTSGQQHRIKMSP